MVSSGFHAFLHTQVWKWNNDTWMKFAEVNEGKHSFFAIFFSLWSLVSGCCLVAFCPCGCFLLCALAACGLSWFLRKPCCLAHLLTTQTGAWPSGLPHLQEFISGTCSEHSPWLQFSANYLICHFGYSVLGCVWVGNRTFVDTINLPKSWLWLQHKDIWCKNINKTICDLKTMN